MYLASLRSLILLALLLSVCAIYPLVDDMRASNWSDSFRWGWQEIWSTAWLPKGPNWGVLSGW